ncbi:MAG: hypothetical protein ACLPPF_13200 [Rhodomicrobium sp.]
MGRAWLARASAASMLLVFGAWSARAAVNAEAEGVAKKVWDTLLMKCGDDYYYAGSFFDQLGNLRALTGPVKSNHVTEFKGAKFTVSPLDLSEAQKLNGVEFIGRIAMISSAFRTGQGGKWNVWSDGPAGRVMRNGDDIWNSVIGDMAGDGLGLGAGGMMGFRLVKIKGVWALSREDSTGMSVTGYKYFDIPKIGDYTNRYDCASSAILAPGVKDGGRAQAALAAQGSRQAGEMAPIRDPRKGIAFLLLSDEDVSLLKTYASLMRVMRETRGAPADPAERGRRSQIVAKVRQLADRFPKRAQMRDDQYLPPLTPYKDVVFDAGSHGVTFTFQGSKMLAVVMIGSGPYRGKYAAIEFANFGLAANKKFVPAG